MPPSTGIWYCKIGECDPSRLPPGSDYPMRKVIEAGYYALTGEMPKFIFSGWGQELSEIEKACVEGKEPDASH